jgi:hypothetical protein
MGARWYIPQLGRWASADTIVPDFQNPRCDGLEHTLREGGMRIPDVLMALWIAMSVISTLIAGIIWYRFSVRAKTKGVMDRDDLGRTVVKLSLLGLCSAIGYALLGCALWVRSIEGIFPRHIQSLVEGAFYSTFCFVAGIGGWLLMLVALIIPLKYRLQRGRDSEPPSQ